MNKKIKKLVQNLSEKYNSSNPFELCRSRNIVIFYSDLGNVKGIFQNADGVEIIHLNNRLNYHEQLYTCAHELGHAMLHSTENTIYLEQNTFYNKNKYENEANLFAVELLLNKLEIDKTLDTVITLEKLSAISGIPIDYLRLKFNY